MLKKILIFFAKSSICKRNKFSKLLEDIPENFLVNNFNANRNQLNASLLLSSLIISVILSFAVFIYDLFFGLIIFIILYLLILLLLIRKVKNSYLEMVLQVEQISDLVCNEIILILSTTKSLPLAIEFLANGSYPVISQIMKDTLVFINLGRNYNDLLHDFALKQPSESIKEFIIDFIIPISKGEIKIHEGMKFSGNWRLRNKFEAYSSQIEGKMSIFLAITTVIPLTVSMLLVIMGYVSFNLMLFLPLVFIVLDLIALEIYNSGKVSLLGGK